MTAFERLYATIQEGAQKYPPNEWRSQSQAYHIEHAIEHFRKALEGDRTEDHLGHGLARAFFAIEVEQGA